MSKLNNITTPLQGVVLDRLDGNLYHCTAVTILSDPSLTGLGDGIERWELVAKELSFVDELCDNDIKCFAKNYNGVAFKTSKDRWIIKGIALGMQKKE
jgi:hypothetical protein